MKKKKCVFQTRFPKHYAFNNNNNKKHEKV